MDLAPGQTLGPYTIASRIGAGGMGEVYRARDTRLARDVAVKVLPSELASDPTRLQRFEQEARAAAALSHPNIVVVHDVGTHDGTPYLVQELLEGQSLQQLLSGGTPLPTRKAVQYAVQIAQGLEAAHAKGIVHRDLKPANLFLTSDGRVKILDFGLAKLIATPLPAGSPESIGDRPTADLGTGAGVVLGTVGYMAPEQVRGQAVDHRVDIFALGCVLYEMLAGRRAFVGGSAADVLSAILSREPAPLSLASGEIVPALEGVVRRCLEKRPEDRFSSVHDLALALELIAGSGPVSQQQPARGRRRPWLAPVIGASVATLVLLAAFFGWRVWRGTPPTPAPKLDPNRVAVALFENRTGDAALDSVAQMTADAITAGLGQVDTVKVVRGTLAGDATRAAAQAGKDAVQTLAEATGAGRRRAGRTSGGTSSSPRGAASGRRRPTSTWTWRSTSSSASGVA